MNSRVRLHRRTCAFRRQDVGDHDTYGFRRASEPPNRIPELELWHHWRAADCALLPAERDAWRIFPASGWG
jgi:hypothetical protein